MPWFRLAPKCPNSISIKDPAESVKIGRPQHILFVAEAPTTPPRFRLLSAAHLLWALCLGALGLVGVLPLLPWGGGGGDYIGADMFWVAALAVGAMTIGGCGFGCGGGGLGSDSFGKR